MTRETSHRGRRSTGAHTTLGRSWPKLPGRQGPHHEYRKGKEKGRQETKKCIRDILHFYLLHGTVLPNFNQNNFISISEAPILELK